MKNIKHIRDEGNRRKGGMEERNQVTYAAHRPSNPSIKIKNIFIIKQRWRHEDEHEKTASSH